MGAKLEQGIQDYIIYIDNREQSPLDDFNQSPEFRTLNFGDYTSDKHENKLHIERKGPNDFIGTFSGGFERFCKEVERAAAANAYLIVLVEESLVNCLDFKNHPHFFHKDVKVTPDFIFRNVRDLIQKYSNLQFLFVKNRLKAAKTIEKLFESGESYKEVDLQYLYDIGQL